MLQLPRHVGPTKVAQKLERMRYVLHDSIGSLRSCSLICKFVYQPCSVMPANFLVRGAGLEIAVSLKA